MGSKEITADSSAVQSARQIPVRDPADPWLLPGYEALYQYFGERGEMETLEVIKDRLSWNPEKVIDGYFCRYEMVLLVDEHERIIGVRDHSIIVPGRTAAEEQRAVVVHLSHILIAEEERGQHRYFLGDEILLRTARGLMRGAGLEDATPIVLAAEVDPPQPGNAERERRLNVFRALGYRPVAPDQVTYLQPDFRPPVLIAASGEQPVPLLLLIKQIGRDRIDRLCATELRHTVSCLYHMYGRTMRAAHMKVVYASLNSYPVGEMPLGLSWKTLGSDCD